MLRAAESAGAEALSVDKDAHKDAHASEAVTADTGASFLSPLDEDGVVISTKGQLVTIAGLRNASKGSAVHFENGGSAFVFDLRAAEVSAAVMERGATASPRRGDRVTGSVDSVVFPVGSATAGRVLDGLGNPIDGKGPLVAHAAGGVGEAGPSHVEYERSLVSRVPGIVARGPTNVPFYTGIKKIDIFAPLGRGQRCALLGQAGTGKTTTALNALIHHAKSDPDAHCVYAAVGTAHPAAPVVELLESEGVLDQFTLVMASRDDSEASKYLALYGACAVAESFSNAKACCRRVRRVTRTRTLTC
jgi:F-type H+-transporting ATPase subunit alpha